MDYPMTTFEVWQQCLNKSAIKQKKNLYEVIERLKMLSEEKKIENTNGFWTLTSKKELAAQRVGKQKISLSKIKQTKRWIRIIESIPYVRGIFLTGTLAMKKADWGSDWDVLVVTSRNRIWIGRLFLSVVLQLLGKRRHGKNLKNRFCLNHFVVEQNLIFEERNEFSANEIAFSSPVLGKDVHKKMINLNENWIGYFKPNFEKPILFSNLSHEISKHKKTLRNGLEYFLELLWLGSGLNRLAKNLMIRKINNNPMTYLKQADIRYGDMSLVFLPEPQRDEIFDQAQEELTFSSE